MPTPAGSGVVMMTSFDCQPCGRGPLRARALEVGRSRRHCGRTSRSYLAARGGGMAMARLLSVNVGLPRDILWNGKTVHTSIWKEPVQGRRRVRRLAIDGDGRGDPEGDGGEHRAVFVYQIESYRYWEKRLGRSGFTCGQLSENFTVQGLPDDEV